MQWLTVKTVSLGLSPTHKVMIKQMGDIFAILLELVIVVVHQSPSHPYPIKRDLMKNKSKSTLKATFTYL